MNEKIRVHIFIKGWVQGIFFRAKTRKKAQEIGIFGWVRNLPDGRVETVCEGEKTKVEKMIEWLKKGPAFARVDNVEIIWEKFQEEFNDFSVLY